ncbi:MAG: hypothetical protein ACR2GT_01805 [Gaiellaceae bacterium]
MKRLILPALAGLLAVAALVPAGFSASKSQTAAQTIQVTEYRWLGDSDLGRLYFGRGDASR